MEGYKVFEPDWTCRGFQYEVGKTFEEDVTPSCCNRGFHFCKELKDWRRKELLLPMCAGFVLQLFPCKSSDNRNMFFLDQSCESFSWTVQNLLMTMEVKNK